MQLRDMCSLFGCLIVKKKNSKIIKQFDLKTGRVFVYECSVTLPNSHHTKKPASMTCGLSWQ